MVFIRGFAKELPFLWESEELTDSYKDYVLEQMTQEQQTYSDAQVFIKTRFNFTIYVPISFSTFDCIIVSDDKLT